MSYKFILQSEFLESNYNFIYKKTFITLLSELEDLCILTNQRCIGLFYSLPIKNENNCKIFVSYMHYLLLNYYVGRGGRYV